VPSRARSAVAPLYLFACLLLGGSAQGIWQNAVLQLFGIAIIAWAAMSATGQPVPRNAQPLLLIAVAFVAVVALQLVPLPVSLWTNGMRERVLAGLHLLGRPGAFLPLSLAPYDSLGTLLSFIPPLALFCAMTRLRAYRASWLAVALVAGTLVGVMLGALQVASTTSTHASWYPYPETNVGLGVGFFANANHMASLLIVSLPFLAAIAAAGRTRNIQRYSAILSICVAAALVLLVGIALNGSLAGYLLVIPVLAGSSLIILPLASHTRCWIGAGAALLVVGAVLALASSSIGGTRIGEDANTSVQSRAEIFATTSKAIADTMPFGSGLGTFVQVYRLYESPNAVTVEYVVHAHDDYAEVILELGVAGAVLMLLFLAWWLRAVGRVWRRRSGASPFAHAASIASAAILIHSTVDYPLRTAAIGVCFAMCLALLAEDRKPQRRDATDLRPTRHVVIG
jgi:O-antigen ligase